MLMGFIHIITAQAPSAVWIGIASALIYSIWDLNRLPDGSRDSLYPVKQQ